MGCARAITLAWVLGASGAAYAETAVPRVGAVAPEFALEVVQGAGPGTLDQLRGQVVVVEFWATYCGWCRSTHKSLAALEAGEPGVTVVGISSQGKRRLVRYLHRKTLGFTVLHDHRRKVARRYRAPGVPTLFVIDRNGVIRFRGAGAPAARRAIAVAKRLAASPHRSR